MNDNNSKEGSTLSFLITTVEPACRMNYDHVRYLYLILTVRLFQFLISSTVTNQINFQRRIYFVCWLINSSTIFVLQFCIK